MNLYNGIWWSFYRLGLSLQCRFQGHDWSKTHGWHDDPEFGAVCKLCGLTNETREEWEARYKGLA